MRTVFEIRKDIKRICDILDDPNDKSTKDEIINYKKQLGDFYEELCIVKHDLNIPLSFKN